MASMITIERVKHTFGSVTAFAQFVRLSRPTVYKLIDDTRERSTLERATIDFCISARRAGWDNVEQLDMAVWRDVVRGANKTKLARQLGVPRQMLYKWLSDGSPRAAVAAGMLHIVFGDAAVELRLAKGVTAQVLDGIEGLGGALGASPLTIVLNGEQRASAVVDACEAMLEEARGSGVTWVGLLNLEQIEQSLRLRNRELTCDGVRQLAKRMEVEVRLTELASVFSEVRLVDAAAENVYEGLRAVKRGDLVVFDERRRGCATKRNVQLVRSAGARVLVVAGRNGSAWAGSAPAGK